MVSGTATAAFEDGTVIEMKAGELFYISTFRRCLTTVGWSETAPMFHFTFWAQITMQSGDCSAKRQEPWTILSVASW